MLMERCVMNTPEKIGQQNSFSACRTICLVGLRQTDAKSDAKYDETLKKGLGLMPNPLISLERETGFEPATSTLARLHSTTELFPRDKC